MPTSSGFSGNARNILLSLEHLIHNGQWQTYNKKLDSLAKKHMDNPEIIQLITELKIKDTKDYRARYGKSIEL